MKELDEYGRGALSGIMRTPRALITWMLWKLDIFGYSNDYDLHDNETLSGVWVQSCVKNS
jgi:hypothetical protein